jgi:hypothetical protein
MSQTQWKERPTVQVDNGQVRARRHERLAHDQAQAARAAGHHADLVLQRKRRQRALEVHAAAALHHGRARHLGVGRVLDHQPVVGARERAFVCAGRPLRRVGGGLFLAVVILQARGRGGQRAGVEVEGERRARANGWAGCCLAGSAEGLASRRGEEGH